MDVFGSRCRRRVHSTEALKGLLFIQDRDVWGESTLCRATEAILEHVSNVEEALKNLCRLSCLWWSSTEQPGSFAEGVSSKRDAEPRVKFYEAHTEKDQ